MYKHRIITDQIKKLTENFPVVVISGARQVGKSTLLQHAFPDIDTVVFDPVTDVGAAKTDPDVFLDNHPAPLILDEIQYAPTLTAAIKRRVDKAGHKPFQYILTGSQQWAVMKNLSESLAGRAIFIDLAGFSLSEISEQVTEPNWLHRWITGPNDLIDNPPDRLGLNRTVYEQIWRGWLPKTDFLDLEFIQPYYRSYMQTYLERDVRIISDLTALQDLGKFTQLVSALTAQEINYSQLGRDINITPQTARRWLNILQATFQWFEIPAYSGNTIKRISSKPKGYIADTGLACTLNMISSHNALGGHPMTGAFFETAVVCEIRKLSNALQPLGLYHWRSHGASEVDLILEQNGMLFPIEIKLTSNPTKKDVRGISAFRKTYPKLKIAPGLVVCPCEKFVKISENDYALPWNSA
ncbi:MAG: ATP-binding protein [Planctomycetota bacterium]|jgi:predicted AAA+ superfamily ATPase